MVLDHSVCLPYGSSLFIDLKKSFKLFQNHSPCPSKSICRPRFIAFYRCCVLYKSKARPFKQKDYNSLYFDTCFIAVIWNWTCSIFKVRLYSIENELFILILSVFSCQFYTFAIGVLNISITAILNFLSNNFKICVMFDSDSDACLFL